MEAHHFLAFDLGAESGRTILGTLGQGRITSRELTRFTNGPVQIRGHLHWNIFKLFEQIKKGMKTCSQAASVHPESLAVDTWGVDFGLLARDGSILGLPFAYRDIRANGAMEEFFRRAPRKKIYQWTGIQFLPFNTLFQLYSMVRDRSPLLQKAASLLFLPDLFTFLLTGRKRSEFTIASTSQLLDPRRRTWEKELFAALEIPLSLMQEILFPGAVAGELSREVAREAGLGGTSVVATASHDTAAAIAAIPASGNNWAYISSGTWSLLGRETSQPIITEKALKYNFTNEGGVEGTTRFLKNITGLWLLHQCRREWAQKKDVTYGELVRLAEEAPPFKAFINPDCPDFLNPPSMPAAIRRFCRKTRQTVPGTIAELSRCILESLALKYRFTLNELRRLLDTPIEKIHIIGGGSQNQLLCQWTANATGLPVIAGPAEATAIGNIMVQALALGFVKSLSEIRQTVGNSVELKSYEPRGGKEWDTAYGRFLSIVES